MDPYVFKDLIISNHFYHVFESRTDSFLHVFCSPCKTTTWTMSVEWWRVVDERMNDRYFRRLTDVRRLNVDDHWVVAIGLLEPSAQRPLLALTQLSQWSSNLPTHHLLHLYPSQHWLSHLSRLISLSPNCTNKYRPYTLAAHLSALLSPNSLLFLLNSYPSHPRKTVTRLLSILTLSDLLGQHSLSILTLISIASSSNPLPLQYS